MVRELFQKIAQIHAMDVPLPKKHWLFEEMDKFYQETLNTDRVKDLLNQVQCHALLRGDFKDEITWIRGVVTSLNSPLVFSHNDLLSPNILVLEGNRKIGEQLILCDFEYAGYGHRGLDLGTVISEWGRLWTDFDTKQNFPDDSTIKHLLEIYVEECERISGKGYTEKAINSLDQLVKEVKLFALAYKLFMVLLFLKPDGEDDLLPLDIKSIVVSVKPRFTSKQTQTSNTSSLT